MTAADQTYRVSIRTTDRETDVTLPAGIPIAELIPAVVDVIGAAEFSGADPHLTRVCGQRLDPQTTLAQAAIHDGELLILTTAERTAPITRFDASSAVADAIAALPEPTWRPTRCGGGHCVLAWAAATVLVLLGRAVLDPTAGQHPVIAAIAALLALTGAATACRSAAGRVTVVSLGVLAVVFAGLSAALLPLGPPAMPTFLVAMAAIGSTSLVAWRLLGCAPEVFLPLAVVAMAAAVPAMGAVAGCWAAEASGPMLAIGSVAVLAASARLSIHSSGLARAGLDDADLNARARLAHHRLTLVVATAAVAAALGAAVTAATTSHPLSAAIFLTIIAALLTIRLVQESALYRTVVQGISSGITVTALAGLCAVAAPHCIPWLCGALAFIGAGAVWAGHRGSACTSPAVRRAVSIVELMLGAAVVPGGCAAAGMFGGLAEIGAAW
ncbi:type VII secretion integral membrane protein EccD [Mycolicibacterium rhodesiae]|uniref:Type VII secretion integral membrane protein EccD n=1 Tax=Mycolicibacterium rhodesiae TaxID=36814 RepID=A0A1X0IMU3_MYCRH|nr:type VII secretion integral membrane protein EccD [Mycolicibacterium rhodesiae]MCV7347304.1 type VII secretion integral membrane protein EccD [Mycolicibacterium rhodesiae]ORB49518.1 type VII secretion integral membrane protein EccD [Mycolicibacterium rhodesiae]